MNMKRVYTALTIFTLITNGLSAQTNHDPAEQDVQALYETVEASFGGNSRTQLPSFETKPGTVGSEFLFDSWVNGTLENNEGEVFSEGYFFNFSKATQNVYLRLKNSDFVFLIKKNRLRSVRLTDGINLFSFEKTASLDSNRLYSVLVRGKKYSLYSLKRTSYFAADFINTGVENSGNKYNEYKDYTFYYLVDSAGKVTELPLKKKTLTSLLEFEKEKVDQYFSKYDNAAYPFDENFLRSLVESLNGIDNTALFQAAQLSFGFMSFPPMQSFVPSFSTTGSKYLFPSWVNGTVIDQSGQKFSEGYLFNFNKASQALLLRLRDSSVAFMVDKQQLQSIVLSNGIKAYSLEKVKGLDSTKLYNVLVKGPKYSLYSFIRTKFEAADYFTNGISSSGSQFDEYKDEIKYYLVAADGKIYDLPFRKKAIKRSLNIEKDKVAEYYSKYDNAGHPFDESFLVGLIKSLNQ
jgi:hypothetical protein